MTLFHLKLPFAGDPGLFLLRLVAAFCSCCAAAREAIVMLSTCSEIFLKTALVVTHSVAFHLTVTLKLNAFLRLALTGALFPPRRPRESARNRSAFLGCGGERRAAPWFRSDPAVLHVLHTIYWLVHMMLSVPSAVSLWPFVSTVTAAWTFTRPLGTRLQTLGGSSLR